MARREELKPTLFGSPSEYLEDMRALLRIARGLHAGANENFFDAYDQVRGGAVAAIDAVRRHELDPCVAEVAAAVTCLALAKDYAVKGFTERATQLSLERADCARASRRIALLGMGSATGVQFDIGFAEMRSALVSFRGDPHADALCSVIDVIGAGDPEAVRRLGALGKLHADLPSVLWLAEVATSLSGDVAMARRLGAELDDLLGSDAFGGLDIEVAAVAKLGRADLAEHRETLVSALAALAALSRGPQPSPSPEPDLEHEQWLAELREAGKTNPRKRKLLEEMKAADAEMEAAFQEASRNEIERYGPFLNLDVPAEIRRALAGQAHYAVLGFRELYGLEILRDTLPELAALVKVSRAMPN